MGSMSSFCLVAQVFDGHAVHPLEQLLRDLLKLRKD